MADMKGKIQEDTLLELVARTALFLSCHPDKAEALSTWLDEDEDTELDVDLLLLMDGVC